MNEDVNMAPYNTAQQGSALHSTHLLVCSRVLKTARKGYEYGLNDIRWRCCGLAVALEEVAHGDQTALTSRVDDAQYGASCK